MNDEIDDVFEPTDIPIDANCFRFSTAAATARFIAFSLECVVVETRGGDEISYVSGSMRWE